MIRQEIQAASVVVQQIPVELIDDDWKWNCRGKVTSMDVQALAKDIGDNGLLQPINIRVIENGLFKYRVIAGFSRMRAMRLLRWPVIPCIVITCTDEEAAFKNLTENLIRKDLTFLQECEAVRQMGLKFPRLTDKELGERLGQSRRWVQIRLFTNNLPDEVKEAISMGIMTLDQIEHICKIQDYPKQLECLRKIKEARERNIKHWDPDRVTKKKKPKLERMSRTKADIVRFKDHIYDSLNYHNFGSRCLVWAAGDITTRELFEDLKNIADNEGIPYEVPTRLEDLVKKPFFERIREG